MKEAEWKADEEKAKDVQTYLDSKKKVEEKVKPKEKK